VIRRTVPRCHGPCRTFLKGATCLPAVTPVGVLSPLDRAQSPGRPVGLAGPRFVATLPTRRAFTPGGGDRSPGTGLFRPVGRCRRVDDEIHRLAGLTLNGMLGRLDARTAPGHRKVPSLRRRPRAAQFPAERTWRNPRWKVAQRTWPSVGLPRRPENVLWPTRQRLSALCRRPALLLAPARHADRVAGLGPAPPIPVAPLARRCCWRGPCRVSPRVRRPIA